VITDPADADILFAEDDDALREMLTWHLQAQGWRVRGVADGPSALAACERAVPDLVVLDVMLPGCDGVSVCRALRERYDPTPGVLMLTARAEEVDVVAGLDAGADDYVVKPCRPAELVARLRALARRVPRAGGHDERVERGRLRIDTRARAVTVDGTPVALTATEYALLLTLARDPGRVFSRAELLELVWHSANAGYARNVDCHVTRLRRKFERHGLRDLPIAAVYGAGYRYDG
jgi:DNA-binding response OmpR family regulator